MLGLWLLLAAGLRRWLALARGSLGFVDTTARAELYTWIRQHSPQTAVVVKPPSGFEDLALHTGRAGFVQFKHQRQPTEGAQGQGSSPPHRASTPRFAGARLLRQSGHEAARPTTALPRHDTAKPPAEQSACRQGLQTCFDQESTELGT